MDLNALGPVGEELAAGENATGKATPYNRIDQVAGFNRHQARVASARNDSRCPQSGWCLELAWPYLWRSVGIGFVSGPQMHTTSWSMTRLASPDWFKSTAVNVAGCVKSWLSCRHNRMIERWIHGGHLPLQHVSMGEIERFREFVTNGWIEFSEK